MIYICNNGSSAKKIMKFKVQRKMKLNWELNSNDIQYVMEAKVACTLYFKSTTFTWTLSVRLWWNVKHNFSCSNYHFLQRVLNSISSSPSLEIHQIKYLIIKNPRLCLSVILSFFHSSQIFLNSVRHATACQNASS